MPLKELEKYQIILKISNAIINQRTRGELFKGITEVLEPIFHFDRISILINEPGESSWQYFSPARGVAIPGLPNDKLPITKGMVPYQAMSEKRTITLDIPNEPQSPGTKFLMEAGLVWMICSPLINRGQAIGSVQLSYKERLPLSKDEIDLFEMISQALAIAIDNMLAYEKLEGLKDKLAEEKSYLKNKVDNLTGPEDIIYASPLMSCLIDGISNVASTDATVLITGKTGTGKDLIARNIHRQSRRSYNTFIKVNCAALVPTLIESELFGHERGAFTGATSRKIGRFEIANDSTLFLDEISELPINTQAKLLQVLQERKFERVGGSKTLSTNVRIIAASNQDLNRLVKEKKFRDDLYYRLSTFPMHVPALRERKEDIPLLFDHFVKKFCSELNRMPPQFDKSAIEALMDYHWPGNIRELENFVERIIILRSHQPVTKKDISSILPASSASVEYEEEISTLDEAEKRHIENTLRKTGGVVGGAKGAAKLLGVKRPTLQYRMKKLGINPHDYKL
jgi:formate hydrogenlyase transcriptional activator